MVVVARMQPIEHMANGAALNRVVEHAAPARAHARRRCVRTVPPLVVIMMDPVPGLTLVDWGSAYATWPPTCVARGRAKNFISRCAVIAGNGSGVYIE